MEEDPTLEVLFEYKGSRKELLLPVSTVCDRIEQELQGLGVSGATVTLSPGLAKAQDNSFFLQRWCSKWGAFVNIDSVYELRGDDRLTVVRRLTSSPVKV